MCNHYLFLENIFTSPEPTLKTFDNNVKKIFFNVRRTKPEMQKVSQIQEGIEGFTHDMIKHVNGNIKDDISLELVDIMLSFVLASRTLYKREILTDNILVDEFCKRQLKTNEILGQSYS